MDEAVAGDTLAWEGRDIVSVTQVPPTHVRRPHINPWLIAVLALAGALVALGAWVVVDRSSTSEPEAAQMIDDLNAAANAGDAAAVRELFTPNAEFDTPDGNHIAGLDNVASAALIPHSVGLRVERVAPVTTRGGLAATFIKYSGAGEGVELVVLQLQDGKIAHQWIYNPG